MNNDLTLEERLERARWNDREVAAKAKMQELAEIREDYFKVKTHEEKLKELEAWAIEKGWVKK